MCRRALSGSRWLARGARGCVCGGRAAPQEAAKPSASRPWSVRCSPLINAETSQHTSSVECWLGSAIIRGRTARSAGSRGASGGALDHLQRSSALADGLGRLRARRHAAPTPQARLRLGRRRTTPAWRQPFVPLVVVLERGSCSSTGRQSSRVASLRVRTRGARDAMQHTFSRVENGAPIDEKSLRKRGLAASRPGGSPLGTSDLLGLTLGCPTGTAVPLEMRKRE